MKITTCTDRTLLTPCNLDRFNYQLDTYIGCEHYCYYCYVLRQAETNWLHEIQVHRDLPKRLADELQEITPQQVYIGYHADPYQPLENECNHTRQALSVLLEHGFSAHILTKSDLVLRDLEILQSMQGASVSVSVAFIDDRNRKMFEARTRETRHRISCLRKLKEGGITTGAMLCPIIPYISETIDLLEELSSCADTIWVYGLSGQEADPDDIGWQNTKRILTAHFKEVNHQAEAAIGSKDHPYWQKLRENIIDFIDGKGLDVRLHI